MKNNYLVLLFALGLLIGTPTKAQQTATIDDLSLSAESFWNGSDQAGGFTSGPAIFRNVYNSEWASWSGFAYSNITDNTTSGFGNQYSAIAGSGVSGSQNYAVGYVFGRDTIDINYNTMVLGCYITNSTYAALSMQYGDAYSKKFGGETGNDEDWFKVTIEGWNTNWEKTGSSEVYLADYRFENNRLDYILSNWQWVSLESLGEISHLTFSLSSSDNGDWGMNTPAYFCLDNLITVPSVTTAGFEQLNLESNSYWDGSDMSGGFETGNLFFPNDYIPDYFSWTGWSYSNQTDTTTAGWINQYSSFAAKGAENTSTFTVSYNYLPNTLKLDIPTTVYGTYVTNNTYAALSMRDGDSYSKKFGGATGNDPDYFKLTITGIDPEGETTGTVEFYLADYRFTDNSKDYIVDNWQWVDLTSLGEVKELSFALSSTDNGEWGMNTPSYFCLDEIKCKSLTYKKVTFTASLTDIPFAGLEINLGQDALYTDFEGKAIFESVSPTTGLTYSAASRGIKTIIDTINVYSDMEIPLILEKAPVTMQFNVSYNNLPVPGAIVRVGTLTLETDANGIAISSEVNPSADFHFTVTKTDFDLYNSVFNAFTDSIVYVNLDKGSIHQDESFNVRLYPIPTVDELNIESESGLYQIELIDLMGQSISQIELAGQQTYKLNTKNIKSGVCLIKITTPTGTIIKRITKQ